jgi:hypothetical protein
MAFVFGVCSGGVREENRDDDLDMNLVAVVFEGVGVGRRVERDDSDLDEPVARNHAR